MIASKYPGIDQRRAKILIQNVIGSAGKVIFMLFATRLARRNAKSIRNLSVPVPFSVRSSSTTKFGGTYSDDAPRTSHCLAAGITIRYSDIALLIDKLVELTPVRALNAESNDCPKIEEHLITKSKKK